MGVLAAASVLASDFKPSLSLSHDRGSLFHYTRTPKKRNRAIFPVSFLLFLIILFAQLFYSSYILIESRICWGGILTWVFSFLLLSIEIEFWPSGLDFDTI